MFKELWNSFLALFRASPPPKQPVAVKIVKPTPQVPAKVAAPQVQPPPPPPPPPPKPRLHEGSAFKITAEHIAQARVEHFDRQPGQTSGPTEHQQQVIFSAAAASSVLAGAGSGKSTTLVSRVLFLRKFLDIPFENMSVFTFTRRSRSDFIEKLLLEAERWGVRLNERGAKSLVRTFHSKALQVGRELLPPGQQFFEFLGDEGTDSTKHVPVDADTSDALTVAEEAANEIEGIAKLDTNAEQTQLLRNAYARCYKSDEKFREAIATLFQFTLASQRQEITEKFNKKLKHLRTMSEDDAKLCDHLESLWSSEGFWPLDGVEARSASGQRYMLKVHGETFFANGYVPALNLYVVLGRYTGISIDPVNVAGTTLMPGYAVADKQLVLLTTSDEPIRFIKNREDAERFKRQLELAAQPHGLSAPAVELLIPGEYKQAPVFSALHALGLFSENIGLSPQHLDDILKHQGLSAAEDAAVYATAAFFIAFNALLDESGLKTFNQLFSMLGARSQELARVGISPLIGAKHLLIDEFQDISPVIVEFVRGLQEELWRKSDGTQIPSLMCVGDDWQSIYGWRGSSPHFLLSFDKTFPGASPESTLLEKNFRSSQNIIDCGESFIRKVSIKSDKRGIADNPRVKSLPTKTALISDFTDRDIDRTVQTILKCMGPDEKVYLLASKHSELAPFLRIRDDRLTCTTFHQSKGLEAEYVVLVGSPKRFGSNRLKNKLYKLAGFPQSFDDAQRDEMLRVAYVATTRAKKFCIWYVAKDSSNAVALVPADDGSRIEIEQQDVRAYLERAFAPLQATVAGTARP